MSFARANTTYVYSRNCEKKKSSSVKTTLGEFGMVMIEYDHVNVFGSWQGRSAMLLLLIKMLLQNFALPIKTTCCRCTSTHELNPVADLDRWS